MPAKINRFRNNFSITNYFVRFDQSTGGGAERFREKTAVKSAKFRFKPAKSLTSPHKTVYNGRVRKICRTILSLRRK